MLYTVQSIAVPTQKGVAYNAIEENLTKWATCLSSDIQYTFVGHHRSIGWWCFACLSAILPAHRWSPRQFRLLKCCSIHPCIIHITCVDCRYSNMFLFFLFDDKKNIHFFVTYRNIRNSCDYIRQLHLSEIEIVQSARLKDEKKINFVDCYFSTLFILRIIKSYLFLVYVCVRVCTTDACVLCEYVGFCIVTFSFHILLHIC